MPSSAIVHAAIFTAGAVVGGCVVAAVSSNRNRQLATSSPVTQLTPKPLLPQPVVGLDATGKTAISTELVIRSNLFPVLKYGHPGESCPSNV